MHQLKKLISDFEYLTSIAYELSMQFEGIITDNKRKARATHILVKLVNNCISILKLLPYNSISKEDENLIYDFSSVASLCRNLIEEANLAWYFCFENIEAVEIEFRYLLFDIHELSEFIKISEKLNFNKTVRLETIDELKKLKIKFEKNDFFRSLNNRVKKLVFEGKRFTHLTQFEIAERRELETNFFKGVYSILSIETHTSPLSISLLGFSSLHDKKNNLQKVQLSLIIYYVNEFLADFILDTSNLWDFKFAKQKSKRMVNRYSKLLYEK